MSKKQEKRRIIAERVQAIEKRYGKGSGGSAALQRALNTVPTGSLALDFELGTGGWPRGYFSGVFGPRDIGKNSLVLHGMAEAQKMGLNCTLIAVEPWVDEGWIRKHGIDAGELLVQHPATGEEAFNMLYDSVTSGEDDFVVFDSIGALLGESETDEDGKPRMGGQAGLITHGMKRVTPHVWRNNVAVIMLNQVRADMTSRFAGSLAQPGGYALEHLESIIIQLKRTKNKFTLKFDGQDVQIGHEVQAHILRNKVTEGNNRKAYFDLYYMETDDYPFGIDRFTDVMNTGKRTGVIEQKGSYYTLPDGFRAQGMAKIEEYLLGKPAVLDQVRKGVLEAMMAGNRKTSLEAVEEA